MGEVEKAIQQCMMQCIIDTLNKHGFIFDSYLWERLEIMNACIEDNTITLNICCDTGCAAITIPFTMLKKNVVAEVKKCMREKCESERGRGWN